MVLHFAVSSAIAQGVGGLIFVLKNYTLPAIRLMSSRLSSKKCLPSVVHFGTKEG